MFWTFHTFVCIANQPWTATKNSSREKIQGNVWKVQNTTGRFLTQLHPSNFFRKNLFLLSQKFPIREFFRSDVLWKLFDIGFPYKILLLQDVLPTRQNGVENLEKTYSFHLFWLWLRHGKAATEKLSLIPRLFKWTCTYSTNTNVWSCIGFSNWLLRISGFRDCLWISLFSFENGLSNTLRNHILD